ncbi:MAG: immunoglobulin domain-containing protein [Verrucomicrobiae bacterium]|nr:immunoglobulin domain-containing protein [Verrucomicrobiae bacterium]
MKPKRTGKLLRMSLKSAIAFLILATASLVGAQTLQTLCSFNSTNGSTPRAELTLGNDGNFYGTTPGGFGSDKGTVFKVTTNGALTTLVSFSNSNGASPRAALTLGNDGHFYGTAYWGGFTNSTFTYGMGTVFKVTTNGTLTTLASFSSTNGANPEAGMTLGNDGNFYGTTYGGGITNPASPYGMGTVFKMTTSGTLTKLVAFNSANGAYPYAALTLGPDGIFYGTTKYGGITNSTYPDGMGTVFKVTTNGLVTTLVSFTGTNGANPYAALTLGNDGHFYGTTVYGGITNSTWRTGMGTVFKVTTNGSVTTLVWLTGINGAYPEGGLTMGNDGNFYGTTARGGITNSTEPYGWGTVFQVMTNGTLTTLVTFGFTNGSLPRAALTLGNDGDFYGTTAAGGITNSTDPTGMGTVFRLFASQPLITVEPQSQTNNAGANVTFLVSARSTGHLGYQWRKNGTNLVDGGNLYGATTSALTITNISASDAASYSVIVSNANGSVTSSNATLTVIDPPVITAQPTNLLVLPGTNVAFRVSLTGTVPFRYQWRFNGTNLLNATNATYAIPSVATNKAGNYSVAITNAAGSATSSNGALTVVVSPNSQTNYASSTATFTATGFSPESLNYQWQKNRTNLVNGGNLSGATNSTLTITSVSDADAAIYNAVVSDASGSVTTSNAVLTVNNFPFIASQPQSQTVVAGRTVTFNVTAYGAPPFIFQWFFNGTPVGSPTAGTNSSSYTLSNVGTNQAGNYSVQVVNGFSSVTSSNALLTVFLPPSLTLQFSAGYPLLNLYGRLGNNFVVEFNTNLAETNWINLLSLTNLPASPYQFLDPAAGDQPARFYRAYMQ